MAISKELSLTDEERDAILDAEWNMRISTISPSGRINATPLWFVWHGGKVWAYCRGQKIGNLRRNPNCTVLVDRAEQFRELQGIMIQGEARILEDAEAEAADPELAEVRRAPRAQVRRRPRRAGVRRRPAADGRVGPRPQLALGRRSRPRTS